MQWVFATNLQRLKMTLMGKLWAEKNLNLYAPKHSKEQINTSTNQPRSRQKFVVMSVAAQALDMFCVSSFFKDVLLPPSSQISLNDTSIYSISVCNRMEQIAFF